MIVYHADTHNLLHEGQCLKLRPARTPIYNLYPGGVSAFGERAFLRPCNTDQQTMQLIDTVFDYVRVLRFPDKPSRFTSVFASLSLEDSRTWRERISRDSQAGTGGSPASSTSGISIYAVECNSIHIADARFLDVGNELPDSPLHLQDILPFALAYWESVQALDKANPYNTENRSYALPELLLTPPVHVLYRV